MTFHEEGLSTEAQPQTPLTLSGLGALTFSPLTTQDHAATAFLFAQARLADDELLIPGYIRHAIKENYFHNAIGRYLTGHYGQARAYKATTAGGDLLGFCMVGSADDYPELNGFTREGSCGELHWLYVEPSMKRHGIGSCLFRQAMRTLCEMGHDRVVVNMLQNKPATQAFYEHMGLRLLAPRLEHNTRSGVTFRVPCLLLGHEELPRLVRAFTAPQPR